MLLIYFKLTSSVLFGKNILLIIKSIQLPLRLPKFTKNGW